MSTSRIRSDGRRDRDGDRGAVAVLVAALLAVIMGLTAIVVDLGLARDMARQAQNAADAAALGAATCMASGSCADPVGVANAYINANGWPAAGSTVFVDSTAQTVQVTLPAQQSPTLFAGAIGQGTPAISRSAKATWTTSGGNCTVCVLGNLNVKPNADLLLDQGDLVVGNGMVLGPNSTVVDTSGHIFVNGGVTGSNLTRSVVQDVTGPFQLLPLSLVPKGGSLPAPNVNLSSFLDQPVTASPSGANCPEGTYASVSSCTGFQGGTYVLTGSTAFTGGGNVTANNVTFILACSQPTSTGTKSAACAPNQRGGEIEVGGSTTLTVTLSSPVRVSAGICLDFAILSDPNNTGTLYVHGNAGLGVTGAVYMKSGTLDYGGTPDLTVTSGQVIVGNFAANGDKANLHIDGCGTTSSGSRASVHLVE